MLGSSVSWKFPSARIPPCPLQPLLVAVMSSMHSCCPICDPPPPVFVTAMLQRHPIQQPHHRSGDEFIKRTCSGSRWCRHTSRWSGLGRTNVSISLGETFREGNTYGEAIDLGAQIPPIAAEQSPAWLMTASRGHNEKIYRFKWTELTRH